MARRRRLAPPDASELETVRVSAEAIRSRTVANLMEHPPIARISADAMQAQQREITALKERAEAADVAIARLAQIDRDGLAIIETPLDAIEIDYLCRDRLMASTEDDDFRALKASIQMHGQRTPLDVVALADEGGRFGLISGFRRLAVLTRLFEETGDARWAKVRVMLRAPATLGQAFVGMVEENEIRQSLSYFERGRICLRAVEQGAFDNVDAALDALFLAASPAKRSKIRSFVRVVEELGDLLRHPRMLGERLGLQIARALRDGHAAALRRLLAAQGNGLHNPDMEQAALRRVLTQLRRNGDPAPSTARSEIMPSGARVQMKVTRNGAVLRVSGSMIDRRALDEGFDRLVEALSRSGR